MPASPATELDQLLADVGALTRQSRRGDRKSLRAWHNLARILLTNTILADGVSPKMWTLDHRRGAGSIGGIPAIESPLKLTNGAYLRMVVSLAARYKRLIVEQSTFQYQLDEDGRRWVFRYDYMRHPANKYAPAHLQIRGKLDDADEATRSLERIHFPIGRPTIEGVIRLLIEDFGVPCRWPESTWRPVLYESETLFLKDATRPPSGPRA